MAGDMAIPRYKDMWPTKGTWVRFGNWNCNWDWGSDSDSDSDSGPDPEWSIILMAPMIMTLHEISRRITQKLRQSPVDIGSH